MRISIDCRNIGNSGIGTFIENVVDEMVLYHNEHEYLLVVNKEIECYKGVPNVRFLITDIKPFTVKELLLFPVRQINKTDVFFSPYINIPMGIKIPIYCTIHDVIFWDMPQLVSRIGLWVRTLFIKHAMLVSKGIFTVSEFSKKQILSHFQTKTPVYVISNGVNMYVRDFSGIVEKEDYILFVGNIKKHKGLDVLVKAYQLAKHKGFRYKLKIVGDCQRFRTSDDAIINIAISDDDIMFTGKLSNESLIKTIASARVLILPSLYEGFGMPPMEALYLGTDAIISDIPVLREIYEDLPVTFFNVGDVDDLVDKLMNYNPTTMSLSMVRLKIDSQYNFARTATIILERLQRNS